MHPILFQIGKFPLHSYGFMLLVGFYAGWMMAHFRAKKEGIHPGHIADILVWCVLGGVVGARVAYVIDYGQQFDSPLEWFKVWEGGLVFYGGLIVATGIVLFILHRRKLPTGKLADIIAPSLAVGLACGRIGCFLFGCCWGDVCEDDHLLAPVAMRFPGSFVEQSDGPPMPGPKSSPAFRSHVRRGYIEPPRELPPGKTRIDAHSRPVIPTQLISSANALILCIVLNMVYRFRRLDGEVFWLFGLLYSVNRFILEILRDDNLPKRIFSINTGLTTSQILSLGLFVVSAAVLVYRRRNLMKQEKEEKSTQE